MSRQSTAAPSTEDQVAELRELIAALSLRVSFLESHLDELQEPTFQVVPEASEPASASTTEAAVETGEFGGPYSWTYRETVAREIGAFIRRALNGSYRGSSGREKLKQLSSRYYIVVKTFDGQIFRDPVRVYTKFNEVRAVCQQGGDWGDSIFVGVPSKREGSIAVRAAGLTWPSQLQ